MEANELRIGNFVYKSGDTSANIYVADHITILMAHNYIPIPLTPEWLERAGFIKIDHIHGYSFWTTDRKKFKHLPSIDIYDTYTCVWGYNCKHVEYIHTLQNLIFALIGIELEFK